MAKNMNVEDVDFSKVAAYVIKDPIEKFVEDSYLPYAHYVIMSRALISEDGLKPVQRRILYAMTQLGLTDKTSHIKAAQIVGETMGKYHPHGDSSIGDALSRLGQDFSLRVPLIDAQGSVGFTTGDAPAAPRYWEGRFTPAAMELVRDIKEGGAKMGLNYDGKFPEPVQLPVKWPSGIINGSQGIAVGYSSYVVPHNPGEVMDAIIALVKNPDITTEQILKIMPGPDFPTGGVLIEYDGVKDYYETGKGSFALRGKYEIKPGARGTHQIIFSEAPYQVSGEQIVQAVGKAKKKDKLKEISYVKDLSDMKNGFKLSIGVKAGANPEVVLREVFKNTPLEQRFSANMNVLVDGVPKISSMKELLLNFVEFRSEAIINKVTSKLSGLDDNIERLDGIIKVLVDIDKAIKIIRNAEDSAVASTKLMKSFKVNEEQAGYILSLPLRRLTKSDSISLQEEIVSLRKEKEYLTTLLNDEKEFDKFMINEFKETKKIIDDPRRTTISTKTEADFKKEAEAIRKAKELFDKNAVYYVTLFSDDTIVKSLEPFKQAGSPIGIITQVRTRAQEKLIFLKRNGSALRLPVSFIPENTALSVSTVTGLPEKSVVGVGKETMDEESHGTLLITNQGGVNIVNGGFPVSNDFQLVKLTDNEEVLVAYSLDKKDLDGNSMVMVSSDGYVLNFPVEQIRTSNSGAGTVRGMNITEGETVVGASIAREETGLIVSCTHQTIKTTKLKDIPPRNRNARGVTLQRLHKDDTILSAFASERVVGNKNGKTLRLPESTDRAISGTKRSGVDVLLGHYE